MNSNEFLSETNVVLAKNIWYVPGSGSNEVPVYVARALENRETQKARAGAGKPGRLVVFSSTGCPHCPLAVKAAVRVSLLNPEIETFIVDVQGNIALAKRFNVKSVPYTLLDDGLSWTGVLGVEEVTERVNARGGDDFEVSVFQSMVATGRLDDAGERLKTEAGPASFSEVWKNSTTATRIGLMMVAEQVLEEAPDALDRIAPLILEGTASKDAALRGDTADLLGQIGHSAAKEGLRGLLSDSNPDVAEIAEEALAAIEDRNGH